MTKKEARKVYIKKRTMLSVGAKTQSVKMIIQLIRQLVTIPKNSTILSYKPIDSQFEIDTYSINEYLKTEFDAVIAFPKTKGDTLVAVLNEGDNAFSSDNKYSIPEPLSGQEVHPADLTLVITPLLIFDKLGFRLGYGKGMYDRYLQSVSTSCTRLGCSYFDPIDKLTDSTSLDKKLNLGITPRGTYLFD